MEPAVAKAAHYAGLTLDPGQVEQIERYQSWLFDEALPAGGLGPAETERLACRHLADSLLYASCFPHESQEVWDLGSGAGLPGIPLAIALPGTRFLLVDRSGRRIGLQRRAIRILELANCQTLQTEIDDLDGTTEVIVTRASLPPDEMAPVARRHLRSGGVAVMGGSWRARPETNDWTVREIPHYALDHTIWLLMMRAA